MIKVFTLVKLIQASRRQIDRVPSLGTTLFSLDPFFLLFLRSMLTKIRTSLDLDG